MRVVSNDIKLRAGNSVPFRTKIYNFANNYPFGMQYTGTEGSYDLTTDYRYGYGGHEKDNDIKGIGNHLSFGDYGYDPRIGKRWNVEPYIKKYPSNSSYLVFANNPILFADPDGKDIIVLRNSDGANGAGHAAILVGDNKNGWTYISKYGYTGSAFGSKPKFVVMQFSSIEEFRNSPHNFETHENHSTTDGKEAKGLTFKLDKDGNKVQRYDQALYFPTTQADGSSTDQKTIDAATKSAKSEYCLMNGDCSDVVGAGLSVSKDNNGQQIRNGDSAGSGFLFIDLWNKRPNSKYNKIKNRNTRDINYDDVVMPDDTKLKQSEEGEKK